ncbi:hypothetical protein EJ08DRAFT_652336 [Tothia fuscella]|uniref:Prion-inhibition and propagation HeLo domain-containing protein n=1 Tax=Tothia fuscella TaxID=1048955 RepID=A0A9P4TVK7_9PEZI|nr:hypothetical protein EJ08DRAFT_652336 [Tothia fuscella]
MTPPSKDNAGALSLAHLFSTCVECLLLIHPGKEWDRDQRLQIAKLGIQQGRLLAWGDMLGVCEVGEGRDPRLDDPGTRNTIEKSLQNIIDRPAHLDRATQFEKYGLKSPRKFLTSSQTALDTARLEAFREKIEILQHQRWEVRRGMSITINHWIIADTQKFQIYLSLIREQVDFLIGLVDIEDRVNRAMKHDIRALGWHPIFTKPKASADMSKLRLIAEACATDYPEYAAATQGALAYLDKEWADSYREAMQKGSSDTSSEIPGAAAYVLGQSTSVKNAYKPVQVIRPGLFSILKPKSWRKSSKDLGRSNSVDGSKGRSMSVAAPASSGQLTPPMSPERSKSIAVMSNRPELEVVKADEDMENRLSQVETATSLGDKTDFQPVTSMISRHDQWQNPV